MESKKGACRGALRRDATRGVLPSASRQTRRAGRRRHRHRTYKIFLVAFMVLVSAYRYWRRAGCGASEWTSDNEGEEHDVAAAARRQQRRRRSTAASTKLRRVEIEGDEAQVPHDDHGEETKGPTHTRSTGEREREREQEHTRKRDRGGETRQQQERRGGGRRREAETHTGRGAKSSSAYGL